MTAIPTVKSFLTLTTQPSWTELACLLAAAAVLTIVLRALGDVVWRSMPADSLRFWLTLKDGPRTDEVARLQWELHAKEAWSVQRISQPQMTRPNPLPPEALAARRSRLAAIAQASRPIRACRYLLACLFCQQMWTALAVCLLACEWTGRTGLMDVAATSLLYGWLSTRIVAAPRAPSRPTPPQQMPAPATTGCPGCQD